MNEHHFHSALQKTLKLTQIHSKTYMDANGSMSEQFNASTGHPLSAYDLTWSLASFVTMARRREGNYPLSWGAMKATPTTNSSPHT
jgi:glucoamylase